MNKSALVLFFVFLMNSPFTFINATYLRKDQGDIPNLDSLLAGLPTSYDILRNQLESKVAPIKGTLSLPYFKSLESNSKVKYYLNKDRTDFESIINDIIASMGISNPKHAYLHNIFEYKIPEAEQYKDYNTWMNYNIITTVRNDENTISYGSLFVTLKDGKYHFIFCYGFGDFKENYNGMNVVSLGKDGNYKYHETSNSVSSGSEVLDDNDAYYIIMFMNLEGFKVLGNKYDIPLLYPDLKQN